MSDGFTIFIVLVMTTVTIGFLYGCNRLMQGGQP
jgi:preprotein translocase subunit SecE